MERMVIIEVQFPTGFDACYLRTVRANHQDGKFKEPLIRIEQGHRKLIYYLTELTADFCVKTVVKKYIPDGLIRGYQPGQARVYSFFEPNQIHSVPYIFPALGYTGRDPQRSSSEENSSQHGGKRSGKHRGRRGGSWSSHHDDGSSTGYAYYSS